MRLLRNRLFLAVIGLGVVLYPFGINNEVSAEGYGMGTHTYDGVVADGFDEFVKSATGLPEGLDDIQGNLDAMTSQQITGEIDYIKSGLNLSSQKKEEIKRLEIEQSCLTIDPKYRRSFAEVDRLIQFGKRGNVVISADSMTPEIIGGGNNPPEEWNWWAPLWLGATPEVREAFLSSGMVVVKYGKDLGKGFWGATKANWKRLGAGVDVIRNPRKMAQWMTSKTAVAYQRVMHPGEALRNDWAGLKGFGKQSLNVMAYCVNEAGLAFGFGYAGGQLVPGQMAWSLSGKGLKKIRTKKANWPVFKGPVARKVTKGSTALQSRQWSKVTDGTQLHLGSKGVFLKSNRLSGPPTVLKVTNPEVMDKLVKFQTMQITSSLSREAFPGFTASQITTATERVLMAGDGVSSSGSAHFITTPGAPKTAKASADAILVAGSIEEEAFQTLMKINRNSPISRINTGQMAQVFRHPQTTSRQIKKFEKLLKKIDRAPGTVLSQKVRDVVGEQNQGAINCLLTGRK